MNKHEEFAKRQDERARRMDRMSEEVRDKLSEMTLVTQQVNDGFAIQTMELTARLVDRSAEIGYEFQDILEKLAANHVTDDVLTPAEMKELKRVRSLKKADEGMELVAKMYMRQASRLGAIAEKALDGLIDQFLPDPEPVPAMTTETVSMGGLYPDEPEGGDQN